MTITELQHLYNTLGSTRACAERLGMSTGTICGYLRRHGVQVRKRGGDWSRHPGGVAGKIERNRLGNQEQGDPAFRAKPVTRKWCNLQRRLCVIADDGECHACLALHDLSSVIGGASSGWDLILWGVGR